MFLIIARTIKEGFTNFIRNGWLSVAAVTVMFLSVFVIGILFILVITSNNLIKNVEDRVNISVYFKPDVTEERITEISSEMSNYSEIKSVNYISKDQALEIFKQDNADMPDIINSLEELGGNPLLASLVIKANNPTQYDSILNYINNASFKDEISKVSYDKYKPVIDKLNSAVSEIKKIGLVMVIIFITISVLIIFNTIRITIYTHKNEIEVMRLVGASNMFIRLPFIFEGIIYGLIAMFMSTLAILILVKLVIPHISNPVLTGSVSSAFTGHFWIFMLIQFLSGIILGVVSSIIAVRKYLKV